MARGQGRRRAGRLPRRDRSDRRGRRLPTAVGGGTYPIETTLREEFLAYRRGLPTYVGEAFDPDRYWRGPVWVDTNWLVARGLERYGSDAAATVREHTRELVEDRGFSE